VTSMHVPAALSDAVAWWASAYADHRLLSVSIRFLHIAGLVIGGGTAIITDRAILRGARGAADERASAMATLHRSHRTVVPALVLVVATGVLLSAADVSTFFASPIYWTKLSLVALLLVNGAGLVAAERLAAGRNAWRRLALGSAASLTLWIVLLFVGTLLTASA
jgi:cytochrome c oxidase subunit IV